jgi:hypothetical protein
MVSIILLLIILLACLWHSYCQNCSYSSTKPRRIDEHNKYKLWPGLMSSYDLEHGETLLGLEEAMEIIWQNQNPPDCSKAKYLIAEPFLQGVGSEMHIYGVGLGLAIETGRVFLQQGGWSWRFKNPHCEGQRKFSMECYYEPLSSSCTMQDAMATMQTTNPLFPQPNSTAKHQAAGNSKQQYQSKQRRLANKNSNIAPVAFKVGVSNKQKDPITYNIHSYVKRIDWGAQDDAELETAIMKHGVQGRWNLIAKEMTGADKSDAVACLFRFRNHLRKKLNNKGGKVRSLCVSYRGSVYLVDITVFLLVLLLLAFIVEPRLTGMLWHTGSSR